MPQVISKIAQEKSERSPLIDPLRQIFSSRFGILMLSAVIVLGLSMVAGFAGIDIEPYRVEIIGIVATLIAGALGYKREDYIRYARENVGTLPTDDKALLNKFALEVVAGLFGDNNDLSNADVEVVKRKIEEVKDKVILTPSG